MKRTSRVRRAFLKWYMTHLHSLLCSWLYSKLVHESLATFIYVQIYVVVVDISVSLSCKKYIYMNCAIPPSFMAYVCMGFYHSISRRVEQQYIQKKLSTLAYRSHACVGFSLFKMHRQRDKRVVTMILLLLSVFIPCQIIAL